MSREKRFIFDGEKLRYWRDRRGYSLRQLAEVAGVPYTRIVRLEKSKQQPSWDIACKLSRALLVSLEEFRKETAEESEEYAAPAGASELRDECSVSATG